jgi:hypothetical protein
MEKFSVVVKRIVVGNFFCSYVHVLCSMQFADGFVKQSKMVVMYSRCIDFSCDGA